MILTMDFEVFRVYEVILQNRNRTYWLNESKRYLD